jgi:hypothetical protein
MSVPKRTAVTGAADALQDKQASRPSTIAGLPTLMTADDTGSDIVGE